jgi:predicted PurR-regulated permease PerM
MMEDFGSATWLRRLITVVLLAGLVLLGERVMDPFIVPLVWAAILGFVSWPGYVWLLRVCHGRGIVAALIMTTVVSLAVIVPLAWLAVVLRLEVVHAYHKTQELLAGGLQLPPSILRLPWIGDQLHDLVTRAAQDPHALGLELRKVTDHSFDQIAHVVGGISRNAVKLLLAVVSLFFVYRGGEVFAAQLSRALGYVLGPRVDNYLNAIGTTVKAVVYGLVLAAAVQGVLVGLGYWVAGAGAPVFLAALTTVCGLIPFAVPALLTGVVLYLVMIGHTVAAISLGVWGGIVVGWTDHMVRPFLISREAQIPFLLVMFGVLGGLAAFGLVGLFIGPVILAVLLAIWREWLHESGQPSQPAAPPAAPQAPRNMR